MDFKCYYIISGKRLNAQVQELVLNVLDYFEKEKQNGNPMLSINVVYEECIPILTDDVYPVTNIALEYCSQNTWENCVRHTNDLVKNWYERERHLADIEIDPIIINPGESSRGRTRQRLVYN
ncbi:hypothetical protein Trydic_g22777 [Trypoxylus dichotomus]